MNVQFPGATLAGTRDLHHEPVGRHRCRLLLALLGLWAFQTLPKAQAGTELNFWHAYTPPGGTTHYSFHLANYKRGLFFGSCGPSTRSLQWEYTIDLAGSGPVYQKEQITVTAEGRPVAVNAGTIDVDSRQQKATIGLTLAHGGIVTNFPGNGTWRIKRAD